jgi:3-isopropylmalate/(R)-2-methylmalate dehydratase small subunit
VSRGIRGPVLKLGHDIDTDVIYPGKYLPIIEPEEMAAHALEGLGPEMAQRIVPNTIVVAGANFGCGSSREQAATSLKMAGVSAIVAQSFSRIFFRNAINQGIPAIQSSDAFEKLHDGEVVTIELEDGLIIGEHEQASFVPLPPFIGEIVDAGGLIPHVRRRLELAGYL